MKRFILFMLVALIFTGCEGAYYVTINRIVDDEIPTDSSSPTATYSNTPTGVPTDTPTLTATPTSTPTSTPTNTQAPTATQTPVIDPTPTREQANLIQLNVNMNLRSNPVISNNVIRTATVGEQFTVFERNGDWLAVTNDTGSGWLFYNPDWVTFISGSLGNVPVNQARAQSRVGYNTLEVFNQDYYFAHLLTICPRYMLVMDNLTLADEIYQRLHATCGTDVIHRNWHPSDGDEYAVRTPDQFVDRWRAEGLPHIIRYSTNEPSCYDNCQGLIAHEIELARLAHEAGFRVVLANTGVGKYSPQSVLRGEWTPLVAAANQYNHLLGFHEYTQTLLQFGFGQMATDWLNDPARVQPEQWSNNVSFDFAPISAQFADDFMLFGTQMMAETLSDPNLSVFTAQNVSECGDLPSYWHLGRSFWILLMYECMTGTQNTVDIVHTEWGWDRLDDINSVVNPLQAVYGMQEHDFNLRGWQSHGRLWNELYWTDWSTAEAAYYQIQDAIELYPANHYFLLFAWTDDCGRDWYRSGFGFGNCSTDGDAQEFHRLLEQAS